MQKIHFFFLVLFCAFLWLTVSDFSRQRFVFDLAAATDWHFGRLTVTDPAFFAVEITRRQWWRSR